MFATTTLEVSRNRGNEECEEREGEEAMYSKVGVKSNAKAMLTYIVHGGFMRHMLYHASEYIQCLCRAEQAAA